MPSAKKDRVTISLHLNKRIYILLKRCGEFEKTPMSRIVDKVLESYVEKYESESLEDMEHLDSIMKEERAREEELEMYEAMDNHSENRLDNFASQISFLEKNHRNHNMPKELLDQFLTYIESQTSEEEQVEIQKLKELHEIENERWRKITEKYPLPSENKVWKVRRKYK